MELAIFICVLADLVVSLLVLFELRFKRRRQFAQLADAVEATAASAANMVKQGHGPEEPRASQATLAEKDVLAHTCSELAREFSLTPREEEVLSYLARGYNCRSVAERMTISEATVKSHSLKIYRKLGVHSQQDVIALACERD